MELRDEGYVRYDDLPLETADRRRIEVEFVSNVYVVDGVRVIQCNVRDITARRIAEQAARRERALLRAVIDNIPDLIFYKDKDSMFPGMQQGFRRTHGQDREEIIGQTDFTLVPRNCRALPEKDREMLATGAVLRVEELIPAHGDGVRYLRYGEDSVCTDRTGNHPGLVGVSRDVTDRKEAEENQRLLSERLKLATEVGQMGLGD